MYAKTLMLLLSILMSTQVAFAKPYTPNAGSKERKAIMDALRKPIIREAKTRPTFIVNYLKVDNGWAFTQVRAVDSKGKALGPDYMDGSVHALLRKVKNQWE